MDDVLNINDRIAKDIIREGDGTDKPQKGCKVFIHFTGTLPDGIVFDTSGDQPFEFTIGEGKVIRGFELGVPTMTRNELATFTFHPHYAYGSEGLENKVPPDTWLTFEIHLDKWLWKDISHEKDGSITKQIIKSGFGRFKPSNISLVNIHLEKEEDGSVVEERDVEFRLGEGENVNICRSIEHALTTFYSKEKSRLFIREEQKVWGVPDLVEVYVITLNSFEKFKESWSLTNEERIEQAKILKEKGTYYFKLDNYKLACEFYKKMLYYLLNDPIAATESEIEEIKSLTVKSYLNSSICNLKLYKYTEAKNDCDSVLSTEPTNIKAMFRKGEALLGSCEAILAKQCFEAILQYEPNNSTVMTKIRKCNETLKAQEKLEKSVYLNMFDKFAQIDIIKEKYLFAQQPDVMSGTLGYWTDEQRERSPTKFEKENPDIIILNPTEEFKNM